MSTAVIAKAPLHSRLRTLEQLLSFPALLLYVLATCVFLFVPRSMADPDIWWHLRNAQLQLQTHAFLHRDLYSFTVPNAVWINHEWLAELPFYAGWHLFGATGLFVVTALAVEGIFAGVFLLAYRYSASSKAALLVCVPAAFLSTVSFGPRTLLFGWICLVLELLLLQACALDRPGAFRRAQWMLPCLFMIWVNTHGSWLIGMVLLSAFIACGWVSIEAGAISGRAWSRSQRRALSCGAALSAIALFANPYGWRLVAYPFDLAFRQKLNVANVEEWASLNFHATRGHVLLACLVLLFAAQLLQRRRWAPYELAYLAIGVYASFTYTRFVFLAAILIFPLLAKEMHGLPPYRAAKNKPWLNGLIVCGLLVLVLRHLPAHADTAGDASKPFPERALPFLESFHPEGPVFNDFLWGGYMEWHLRQIPVLIDSRVDIFEYGGVLKDYLDAVRLQNSLAILAKYKIRYVLFEPDTPLVYLLKHTGGWRVDYQDASTVLLERLDPHGG